MTIAPARPVSRCYSPADAVADELATGLHIDIAVGTGSGPTELAAFDTALEAAGIANFNLVRLSSVIPAGATVGLGTSQSPMLGNWGDRLYVVYADQYSSRPGQEAWAGIGWVQMENHGAGLFVEHHGPTEHAVRDDIRTTLTDMCVRRGLEHLEQKVIVAGITCIDDPVCALVVAPYSTAGWDKGGV